ncbi:MAG: CZB domain-containing protein [Acidovorax sp.]|uniref:CZB domain-containing protein n=1 Tax=Acidovorax sp. TaxID=1872122 RepID=UPI00391A5B52
MEFLRRVLGGRSANSVSAAPLALFDSSSAPDSRRPDTLLAALDIDAAINAHERWKSRLMDYLEGRTSYGVDPALVRRDTHSALGRWLHGVGAEVLGDQPTYPLLLARHKYFHEQAANLVELAQQGEWDKAVQVLNGGYRYGSSQVVLLLKGLKRGLEP